MSEVQNERVSVSLKDFLRVTVAEREAFPSHEDAANELGLTVNSFRQRLTKTRKRYPKIYEGVPRYSKVESEAEALAILQELQKSDENQESEAETPASE